MRWYLIASEDIDNYSFSALTFYGRGNKDKLITEYKEHKKMYDKYDYVTLVLVNSLDNYLTCGEYKKVHTLKSEGKEQ